MCWALLGSAVSGSSFEMSLPFDAAFTFGSTVALGDTEPRANAPAPGDSFPCLMARATRTLPDSGLLSSFPVCACAENATPDAATTNDPVAVRATAQRASRPNRPLVLDLLNAPPPFASSDLRSPDHGPGRSTIDGQAG